MSNYDLIRQAILDRHQIFAMYDGYERELCPHVIGTKNGEDKMLAYQFGGDSSRGLPPQGEWRCFYVDRFSNVTAKPGEWHSGTSHLRRQTCVDEVDVEVDY